MKPLISICIPAYKHVEYLKRLLDSIAQQSYRDFEVVVTDDSPDDEVKKLCEVYADRFPLVYSKNALNLNTPENWNEAIRNAKGKWIKLIHDDDWFSSPDSLLQFAKAIQDHPSCRFFFSAYTNVYEDTGRQREMRLQSIWKNALYKDPNTLIADNVVGPPSVVLHQKDGQLWYDRNMKYVVDIDFYIRYLKTSGFHYIDQPLINVGINSAQVTKYTFGVAEVHLKESLQLLEKTGPGPLENIITFDGWWRLIRNFSMKDLDDIRAAGYHGYVPPIILGIMNFQKNIPRTLLKLGAISKGLMSLCYLLNKGRIRSGSRNKA